MKLLTWILDLLYPPKCVLCGKLLTDYETDFCKTCRSNLSLYCGENKTGEFYACCIVACNYIDDFRDAVLRYKFSGKRNYAPAFGRLLAMRIAAELQDCYDVMSWIPVSRERRRERGYDQAYLLEAAVARELGQPLCRTLTKVRNNRAQSGLNDPAIRRGNVINVYEPYRPEEYRGKRILLIDDIVTTGATLSEGCRVLLTAGAENVVCAALAAPEKKTSR